MALSCSAFLLLPACSASSYEPADGQEQVITTKGNSRSITSFHKIVIVGDSLSDQQNLWNRKINGGCPKQDLGYWGPGRSSNGYNWVDYFAQDVPSLAGRIDDLAFGGARIATDNLPYGPSMQHQVDAYASTHATELANDLVVVWGGTNDIASGLNSNLANGTAFGQTLASQLTHLVLTLTRGGKGVTHFLVVNQVNLNDTPLASVNRWTPAQKRFVDEATVAANDGFARIAGRVPRGTRVATLDMASFFQQWTSGQYASPYLSIVHAPYQAIGNPCPVRADAGYKPVDAPGYLFFDEVHPTALAYSGIAGAIEGALAGAYSGLPPVVDPVARIAQGAMRQDRPGHYPPPPPQSRPNYAVLYSGPNCTPPIAEVLEATDYLQCSRQPPSVVAERGLLAPFRSYTLGQAHCRAEFFANQFFGPPSQPVLSGAHGVCHAAGYRGSVQFVSDPSAP
jgi:lysophospholipase L1-like esterase